MYAQIQVKFTVAQYISYTNSHSITLYVVNHTLSEYYTYMLGTHAHMLQPYFKVCKSNFINFSKHMYSLQYTCTVYKLLHCNRTSLLYF